MTQRKPPTGRMPASLVALTFAIPIAAGFLLPRWSFIESLEARAHDVYVRAQASSLQADDEITIAIVDELGIRSIVLAEDGEYLRWPWPRSIWAVLCMHLKELGAKAIVFDLLFTDPSPEEVRFEDEEFAGALAEIGNGYLVLKLEHFELPKPPPSELAARETLTQTLAEGSADDAYKGVSAPLAPLTKAARSVGFANVIVDPDGTIRRLPQVLEWNGRLVPSLALSVASGVLDQPWSLEESALRIGDHLLPLDEENRLILRPRGESRTYRTVSAADLVIDAIRVYLEEKEPKFTVPKDAVDGKIIIIGANASGIEDIVAIATDDTLPGAELQATVIDQLLNGEATIPTSPTLEFVWASLLGVAIVFFVLKSKHVGRGQMLALLIVLLPIVVTGALMIWDRQLGVVVPSLAGLMGFLGAAILRGATDGRRQKWLKSTFNLYLAPKVIDSLRDDPDRLKLGGRRRLVSIFFSDLANFTSISEKLSPEELTEFMNLYLSQVTDRVMAKEGTLDKYIGDAVMAFFSDPVEQTDHAARALDIALEHDDVIREISPEMERLGLKNVIARVGVHTGEAVLGNLGSQKRFAYTAMGDTVNLASRLEGINKYFGTRVIASDVTLAHLPDPQRYATRLLGRIQVKGKEAAIGIHEIRRNPGDSWKLFEEGLQLYREEQVKEAEERFLDSRLDADGPSLFYRARIRDLSGEIDPDGVIRFESK